MNANFVFVAQANILFQNDEYSYRRVPDARKNKYTRIHILNRQLDSHSHNCLAWSLYTHFFNSPVTFSLTHPISLETTLSRLSSKFIIFTQFHLSHQIIFHLTMNVMSADIRNALVGAHGAAFVLIFEEGKVQHKNYI